MRYWGASEVWSCVRPLGRSEVPRFEQEFAAYIGAPCVTATRYARTALYLALVALDVSGHEVLLPAFTCNTVRDAVCLAGAIPIFVDVDPRDLSMNIHQMRQKTTGNTKALIITHYYGNLAANFDTLLAFARENHLAAIEDCAHCLGLDYKGQKVGTFGDMAAFSLGKNTLDFGGGIVVCQKETHHERIRRLVAGQPTRGGWPEFGITYPIVHRGLRPVLERAALNKAGNHAAKGVVSGLTTLLNAALSLAPSGAGTTGAGHQTHHGWREVDREEVGRIQGGDVKLELTMPRAVAALGRAQLRKVDFFNQKRISICSQLIRDLGCYYLQVAPDQVRDTIFTFLPMSFEHSDIHRIQAQCEKGGLSLLTTWPSHQAYWPEQDTENVRKVARSLLMWWVHPTTTRREAALIRKILSPFARTESHYDRAT